MPIPIGMPPMTDTIVWMIPVRLYKKKSLILFCSLVHLPKDPLSLYEKDILEKDSHLGYFITPSFDYYGFIKHDDLQIVIGPTRQIPASEKDLRDLAFQLDLTKENADIFIGAMKGIVHMPLESLVQMLSVLNYVLNDEKISFKDVAIYEKTQDLIVKTIEDEKVEKTV